MTIATTTHAPVDFLRVADLTPSQLEYLLDLAAKMTATPEGWRKTLRTQTVACFFEKQSRPWNATRTRRRVAGRSSPWR